MYFHNEIMIPPSVFAKTIYFHKNAKFRTKNKDTILNWAPLAHHAGMSVSWEVLQAQCYCVVEANMDVRVHFVLLFAAILQTSVQQEPTCISRFDYDFKVLSKLVDLENTQKQMQETIIKQQTWIGVLEEKLKGNTWRFKLLLNVFYIVFF